MIHDADGAAWSFDPLAGQPQRLDEVRIEIEDVLAIDIEPVHVVRDAGNQMPVPELLVEGLGHRWIVVRINSVSNGMDAPTRNGINVPKWKCHQPLEPRGASTMKITTVGIDLAKNVFQVHAGG